MGTVLNSGYAFALVLVIQWDLIFILSEPLARTFFVYAIHECVCKTVHMCMLASAFTNRLYDKNQPRLSYPLYPLAHWYSAQLEI